MTNSSTLERQLLLGVATFALLMAASPTFAQDTDEDVVEDEIIATGIRQSIKASLDLKRGSDSIIEAITAEDIGKLPDVSIADSLARLPGVTAQRVRGRAQQISIRGLGPDFSLALLNGREIVSAGSNRGIEFDQFPSELINQGVVYKTPDASLSAIGIAGAVDLRTIKPLDFNGSQLNVSAKYVLNDNGQMNPDFGDDGYRLFGSYVTQNDAGTVGLSIGVTHQSNPTQYQSRELKTSGNFDTNGNFTGGQISALPNGTYYASDNPRTGVVSREFNRTSVAGALQFEPTDAFTATFDGFYSDFSDAGVFRGLETPIASWSGANLIASTGTGTFVESATYSPAGAILRTDIEGAETEIFAFGANFELDVSERLTLKADVSYSELDREDIDYESYAGTAFGSLNSNDPTERGAFTYITPESGEYQIQSSIDYSNPANVVLTDPGGWGQVGFVNQPIVDDELRQLRAEAEYRVDELPFIEGIQVGIVHTGREKGFRNERAFLRPGAGFVNGEFALPQDTILGTTDSGSIGLDIVAYDSSSFLTNGTYIVESAQGPFYSIDESINTLFAKVLLGNENGRLNGNLGIQYVDVTQGSTGLLGRLVGGSITQEVEESYDHVLPSLNLSYEIVDDVLIRGGLGKSVTRPRLDDLAANVNFGFNPIVCPDSNLDQLPDQFVAAAFNPPGQVCIGGGGGNPFLRPYESTNYDASGEWYFSDAGAISIAVFHKSLDEYVQGSTAIITDADFISGLIGDPGFVSANPDVATFSIGGPTNTGTGSLTGVEVSLRLPFDDVIDMPIKGFGFNGSFGYTDAEVDFTRQNGDVVTVDIPGYSDTTASGEFYYENNGWRARVNTAYRSGYVAALIDFGANPIGAEALSRTTVDAQIGYEFQSGPLEGLSVNIEAYNLNDEPFRTKNTYATGGSFVSIREDYGTTYNFTVAKKF
ncbi:TonB-dependent receptor [Algimonas arctica]|uniref:TonB-dependent receptor n=1 Tax=Algimonas arctica TaxID=1479486 RepID=A0A8J3CSP5_9PROT|nr:TonB-dependent receptor [Algimonas arctica]GHB04279.1 TonB-dependent receptor [Algimonas arctica]